MIGTGNSLKPAIVYQAINLINGKRYIGVTSLPLERRRQLHIASINDKRRSSSRFVDALRLYGCDLFQFSVVQSCSTEDDAYVEERRLIAELKPEYNIAAGGRGIFVSPERRFRRPIICMTDGQIFNSIKAAADFYHITISRICSVLKGRRRTTHGRAFSYYTGAETPFDDPLEFQRRVSSDRSIKISNAKVGHVGSGRKRVLCLDDGQLFPSISATALHYGLHQPTLSAALNGKVMWLNGLRFRFAP